MAAPSRRAFLKSGAGLGVLAVTLSVHPALIVTATTEAAAQDGPDNTGHVTPCLKVDETGHITLCVPVPDMGQGMITTAAQMIAEELDVDLDAVSVELMPFLGRFQGAERPVFDRFYQGAGGSGSTMRIWHALRRTAAHARALLVQAAAKRWGVPAGSLTTADGHVIARDARGGPGDADGGEPGGGPGRRLPYGALVAAARASGTSYEVIPDSRAPKARSDWSVIGRDTANVDGRAIVTGRALFGLDVEVPGMLHAVIRRCPHLKGEVTRYDDTRARALPGVRAVVPMKRLPEDVAAYRQVAAGVAVVADSLWQAKKAAAALDIVWDGSRAVEDDTVLMTEKARAALDDAEMTVAAEAGDLEAAFAAAADTHTATYDHPHWAHTCMEPMNCIAHVTGGGDTQERAEIWVGHQFMNTALKAVTMATGILPEHVTAHFYRMGTGFGRRFEEDFIMEAAILSRAVGAPVKVTWSREDEIEQDYCNPLAAYRVRAALDARGDITAWHMRVASDTRAVVAAREFPVGLVDTYRGEWFQLPNHVSRGAWRGPHHNVCAWVIQSFLNELAVKAGRDPLEYLTALYGRKAVLKSRNWPYRDVAFARHIAVLEAAADAAGHGPAPEAGRGRGIAVHQTFVSVCAHVVEVEMTSDTDYRVTRVTSAIDCGLAVNPNGVRAQVESGIMDGLCAARYGKLVFERGVPVTNNFDTYRKLRMDETPPVVDVHILDMGDSEPRGTGEISLPPVIPALTNALYQASGRRIRSLPLADQV
ncbi:xanthine dehydrogenase family protein molybdopterin-binding subunit [Eilatimonas milleporae]|uniref:Isoquinoline 1-oxidoreductase beta subunit n=1 Tax=Eilatimonas milleporae TaxID=911205 RepID=A0A3M0CN54_9PROT|nr:molybdopterin cofactor-binding domain-containing protein [Eilatimonas milleporae]RMB04683.1 isoquinoline 1-oxidoreductase beta subunit [Eilatimonas milleporae]